MKKEEILQKIVSDARGIPPSDVKDTLSYIVIRDKLDESDWDNPIRAEDIEVVSDRLKNKVRSFLEKWGDQIGKM